MVPRCEKSIGASGRARTYVMKVQSGLPGFGAYGKSALLRGAGAFAIVVVRRSANEADVGTYFIITERRETSKSKHGDTINAELQSTVGSPRTEWICSLNRRLQRLFRWGDAFATPTDLATAVGDHNEEELVAIMPGCAALIDRGETHLILRVEEAIRCGLPALTDCKHTFFTEETPLPEKCGGTFRSRSEKTTQIETLPCPRGPTTRCTGCGATRCVSCAHALVDDAAARRLEHLDLLRVCHDCAGTHEWRAQFELKTQLACLHCGAEVSQTEGHCEQCGEQLWMECGLCGGRCDQACECGAKRCKECIHESETKHRWTHSSHGEADTTQRPEGCSRCGSAESIKVCECGARRCAECIELAAPCAETLEVWQNPLQPEPFYVDVANLRNAEKKALLLHELGDDAPLADFARKFVDIFGLPTGPDQQKTQKSTCLQLYREYAKIADNTSLSEQDRKTLYSKTCMIPPIELSDFERVWDPEAPQRCLECTKEIPKASAKGGFCSDACRYAGSTWTCVPCGSKIVCESGVRVCTGEGCWVARDSAQCAALKRRNEEEGGQPSTLHIAGQMWLWKQTLETDPNHAPAWTKRRRL